MKKALLLFGSVLTAAVLSACGNSGGGSNNNVVCNGAIINGVCQTGVITPPNTVTYKSGVYGSFQQMTIQNAAAVRSLLQNHMGACDRSDITGGSSSCNNWTNLRFQVTAQLNPTGTVNSAGKPLYSTGEVVVKVNATVPPFNFDFYVGRPRPQSARCIYWLTSFTTAEIECTVGITATPAWINNYQGLEFRGYGPFGTASGLTLLQVQLTDILTQKNEGSYNMSVSYPHNNVPYVILTSSSVGRVR